MVPGQAGDAPLLKPLLAATAGRVPVVDEVVGDKSFDGDPQRHACLDRGAFPNIPNKVNRVDPAGYKERNKVERLFGKAKQFRRFATRYEKLRTMFLGVVHLVLGFLRLRRMVSVNTP